MSDDAPDWLPTVDDGVSPTDRQASIAASDAYPMRVLAGAGTGKTFTMVRKIAHLVDERGVPPDRVLALTFTNDAADSMREKLHATLGTAGYDVDAYTYHSVCNHLLTEYAYEAGLDPDFEVATEAEADAIVRDVLDAVEYRFVTPNVYGPDSYAEGAASALRSFVGSMKRGGISPADVDAYLGPADRLYDLAGIPDRIEAAAGDHLGGRSVSTVRDGLPAVRATIAGIRDEVADGRGETAGVAASVADFLDRLVDVCDALAAAFAAHEADERALPDAAHKLPKYLLGGYASGAPSGVPDLDLELTDRLRAFLDDCRRARDLNAGYAAYERELADRNLLDFDGLVVETVSLLETDAGDEIADRWGYVFCDEFQDTDRLQFDLVASLVSDDRLFAVGDDDQAIYEWRGARVANVTDELESHFGEALEDEPLTENFRSRQPILDLANEALSRLDGRAGEKTLTRVDEPAYDGDAVVTVEEADDEDDRARQVATVVGNLLTGAAPELDRAYDPGEVAILVRKNDHAGPILDAFDREGIPYRAAGGPAAASVGVGTVVAYLSALARPETDDVSWNRVLTMRYRLADADLRRLNAHDDGVLAGLRETPLDAFEEPDRVREARDHVDELLDLRETASIEHLYRGLRSVTDVEWYLSERARRDLDRVTEVVERYGDGDDVRPSLSPAFVETLRRVDLRSSGESTPIDGPDPAADAVTVTTIHRSKGLDFPAVVVPRLTAGEWAPRSRRYDALEAALADGPEAAFREDAVARDAREARRLLHVAITRAEDVLVLHGSGEGGDGDDLDPGTADARHPTSEAVDDLLPASVPWRPGAGHLPVWRDLRASLPASAADWTDSLARTVVGDAGGRVVADGDDLPPAEARERVLDLAERLLAGDLDPDAASDESTLAVDRLAGPSTPGPALEHSYTSLEAYETCPRQHYLDHVVGAFDDYADGEGGAVDGVSRRVVGVLFHETAEAAAAEGATDPDEWAAICERLAARHRARDALPAARACIDRYFDLELGEWEVVDAEREFHLDLDGHGLTGVVDAVYRTPSGELVVVDYKATERRRDLDSDRQLPIYLLACRSLYDEPVSRAGYAYVGPAGPDVAMRSFDAAELEAVRSAVVEMAADVERGSFDAYESGTHCRWCRHGGLPCAEE